MFNLAPIELKLILWIKGGEVNIPTKFEVNPITLDFIEIYALCCLFYFYGPEMYRLYRIKLYGLEMVNLYKENDVIIQIMGKC